MSSQLYLWHGSREMFKSQIELYVNTFSKKVFPLFSNIEQEADELSDNYFNCIMGGNGYDEVDPADVAQNAIDAGLEYYENLSLMKYNTIAMCIAMMYQFWEQQVRKFLFDEVSRYYHIEFKDFCSKGIRQIKSEFKAHDVDLENLQCWKKINELRLLCNVIKHGDGDSASELKNLNADFLLIDSFNRLELYNTTLLKAVLNIDESHLSEYGAYLINFWNELPERMYSK
ncbi:hypothetical protein [Tumebacillus permanentifrigoris]|uniref:Uncharacterized protein n=1 Tax=Tumebacillus permanentifrigoris TaxID=378543 RepID=A0A316D3Y1_9BACL|nr:hypothetical protein [Tumebacillus permanentifrigoris]PWK06241.1 hypothetical protein C7459_1202 [Tumebacillus permanentifrigoris]